MSDRRELRIEFRPSEGGGGRMLVRSADGKMSMDFDVGELRVSSFSLAGGRLEIGLCAELPQFSFNQLDELAPRPESVKTPAEFAAPAPAIRPAAQSDNEEPELDMGTDASDLLLDEDTAATPPMSGSAFRRKTGEGDARGDRNTAVFMRELMEKGRARTEAAQAVRPEFVTEPQPEPEDELPVDEGDDLSDAENDSGPERHGEPRRDSEWAAQLGHEELLPLAAEEPDADTESDASGESDLILDEEETADAPDLKAETVEPQFAPAMEGDKDKCRLASPAARKPYSGGAANDSELSETQESESEAESELKLAPEFTPEPACESALQHASMPAPETKSELEPELEPGSELKAAPGAAPTPKRETKPEAAGRFDSSSEPVLKSAFMSEPGPKLKAKQESQLEPETKSEASRAADAARLTSPAPAATPAAQAEGKPDFSGKRTRSGRFLPVSGAAAVIKYVCPKCKTPGSLPADRVGAIVTCSKCGKAMRLTLKR